jgi:formamidopyrimidine-DNA glycosylase
LIFFVFYLGISVYIGISSKKDYIIIGLSNDIQIIFDDSRGFEMLYSCYTIELNIQSYLKFIGFEHLSNNFNKKYLLDKLSYQRMSTK